MGEGVPVALASNQVEHDQETWYITEPLVSVGTNLHVMYMWTYRGGSRKFRERGPGPPPPPPLNENFSFQNMQQ